MKKLLAIDTDIEKFNLRAPLWEKHGVKVIRVNTMQDGIALLGTENFIAVGINSAINYKPLLSIMKSITSLPIHIVTEKHDFDENIEAIRLGADVYAEWLPEAEKSVIRGIALFERFNESHEKKRQPAHYISYRNLTLYLDFYAVFVDDTRLEFRKKEFELLHMLIINKGKTVTQAEIYQKVWGEKYFSENSMAIYDQIQNLRQKLYKWSELKDCIETEHVVGYRLK